MKNTIIKKNLTVRKNQVQSILNANTNLDPLLKRVLYDLYQFDFEAYKERLSREILVSMEAFWINAAKGIKKEEKLNAILFEYGHFFRKNTKAEAYGIAKWKDHKTQTDKFDMGSDYDFTTGFYACKAISLNFFDSLETLDYENLPATYKNEDSNCNTIENNKGYYELIALHQYEGMIAIHDVLIQLNNNSAFEVLNYNNNFMFLMQEHDSGETYPLLLKKRE